MEKLTHLSLFSGIGGLDLAAEWAGFETVGQCEWADFPTKVLEKHWPDVPRWRDIRTLNGESFYERTGRRTVDVISGGFPCQPFSVAGNQKGKEDERYLWPEMLRVIRELAPRWVIGENVSGILQIAAADVVKDLEHIGYNVAVFNFEAAAVGARHRRERVFFVAENSNGLRCDGKEREKESEIRGQREFSTRDLQRVYREKIVENADCIRRGRQKVLLQQSWRTKFIGASKVASNSARVYVERQCRGQRKMQPWRGNWWCVEPNVGRVANGVPSRVDRLKCLGNAVVPQQAYPIFKAIADIERTCEHEAY